MTRYFCDPTKNFVLDKEYTQTHLGKNVKQHDAIAQCKRIADGNDFFVQQHQGPVGHTICGVFKDPLTGFDEKVTHDHTYGSVCERPMSPRRRKRN